MADNDVARHDREGCELATILLDKLLSDPVLRKVADTSHPFEDSEFTYAQHIEGWLESYRVDA